MGRKGKPLSAAAAEEAAIRKAEKKAKKAAKRAIVRENRAKGIVKPIEGWEDRSRRVAKEQGLDLPDPFEDVFGDGKVHAKWGPLFKKHLGLLESHIKALSRWMDAMKSDFSKMDPETRELHELNPTGKWRVMCGMMDRARETLISGRQMGKNVIPPSWQTEKKGLGVMGLTYEPLIPDLVERARQKGIFWDTSIDHTTAWGAPRPPKENAGPVRNDYDSDVSSSDSESDSSSDSESDSEVEHTTTQINAKSGWGDSSSGDSSSGSDSSSSENPDGEKSKVEAPKVKVKVSKPNARTEDIAMGGMEPNPYFVIDTKPTPVNLTGGKSKKRMDRSEEEKKDKKAKQEKAECSPTKPATVGEPESVKQSTIAAGPLPVKKNKKAKPEKTEPTTMKEQPATESIPTETNGSESAKTKKSKKRSKDEDVDEARPSKKSKRDHKTEGESEELKAAEINGISSGKKSKKHTKEEEPEEAHASKKSKKSHAHVPELQPAVDFAAIEAKLQAEVEAGLKAKEQLASEQADAESKAEEASKEAEECTKPERVKLTKKEKKKRKRESESDGVQAIVESFKKKQKLEERRVKKAEEAIARGEVVKGDKKLKTLLKVKKQAEREVAASAGESDGEKAKKVNV